MVGSTIILAFTLVPNGCPSAEKKFAGPKMGCLGPKRGQNEVLGLYLG